MKQWLRLFFILLAVPLHLTAQSNLLMVTYGPEAPTHEGDDDFQQVVFLQIPASISDSLYLRIFDIECGGSNDLKFTTWDTRTRFTLYAGDRVYSEETQRSPFRIAPGQHAGMILHDRSFSEDPILDNEWFNFAKIDPRNGEHVDGNYYFKLVIEGLQGNDANAFDIRLSRSDSRNQPPKGTKIFSYAPTIRLTADQPFANVQFFVPDTMQFATVHNFDLAGADVALETAFRSNLLITSSGQGEWVANKVDLDKMARGRPCSITFGQGGETPNDATFYITDDHENPIAIDLPVYVGKANSRPIIKREILALSDCHTIVFDAKASSDADGDVLEVFWDFGDGQSAVGSRVAHQYVEQKTYRVRVIISDNSGQVGNSSFEDFDVTVNQPPSAEAGQDIVAAPGEAIRLDGSSSRDTDGRLQRHMWNFGDGASGQGEQTTHTFSKPGFFDVALRVEDNSDSPCNHDTDELRVWINASPKAVAGENQTGAAAEDFTFNAGGSFDDDGEITKYTWDFGDGSKGEGKIAKHAYQEPGTYEVRLTIKDNASVSNSTASDKLQVKVNHPPVAIAGEQVRAAIDEAINFDGSRSSDRDGKIINYAWDFGDGMRATGSKTTHAYARPGKYEAVLTVRDNSGTTSAVRKDIRPVIINAPPVAVAGDNQLITASEARFDASMSSDSDGKITNYNWDFGDGHSSNKISTDHVYAKPGTYRVRLSVVDDSGTKNDHAADAIEVKVNEKPIADAGPDRIAAPGQVLIFDGSKSVDADGQVMEYEWDFGDGRQGSGQSVEHAYEQPGVYTARLMVRDDTGHEQAIDFDAAVVKINFHPRANGGFEQTIAPNSDITFDASESFDPDGKVASYEWVFSDELGLSQESRTTRQFSEPGIYSAILTVTDDSGARNSKDTDTVRVRVNSAPKPVAGADIKTCGSLVAFDASATTDADGDPLTFSWDFGDGSQKVGAQVAHDYGKSGTFPVILTVDDGLGLSNSRASTSISVIINHPPIADAGKDDVVCSGEIVLFNAGSSTDPEGGLLRYQWDFGDGTKAGGLNPTKTYKKAGVYQVKLTIEDDSGLACNTDTDTRVIQVVESPVAIAGPDTTICANSEMRFDGTHSSDFDGVVNSFLWDFGDGSTGGGARPTHIYKKAGTYKVILAITGDLVAECDNTDTDDLIVTVHEAPVADFTSLSSAPLGSTVQFDASASTAVGHPITDYRWDFGDGGTGTGKTAEHRYHEAGNFLVTLTVATDLTTDCNLATSSRLVTINESPAAAAGKDRSVGLNELIEFDGSSSIDHDGAIVSYQWDFGDGETGDGIRVYHRFKQAGQRNVILRVRDNTDLANNSDTDTIEVSINAPATPKIISSEIACVGEEVAFNAAASLDQDGQIMHYRWNFGDGTQGQGMDVTHRYTKNGTYNVTLHVDDGQGVSNSVTEIAKNIVILQRFVVKTGAKIVTCPGQEVTFNADKFIAPERKFNYSWKFPGGIGKSGKIVSHAFEKPGTYQVRLLADDGSGTSCGKGDSEATVIVNSQPVAVAGDDQMAFVGGAHDAVLFDATGSHDPDGHPLTYHWDFGDGTTGAGPLALHSFEKPGIYKVKLMVDDGQGTNCGSATDEMQVNVQARKPETLTSQN